MAILTGSKIRNCVENKSIYISGFTEDRLNPNSYNLTLANTLVVYRDVVLDCKRNHPLDIIEIPDEGFTLMPGRLYLGSTNEITQTDKYVPIISGRSSLGRLGVGVHVTAGFGDIGFSGKWTLEITCVQPTIIYKDMEICQIYFNTAKGNTDIMYVGKYQCQDSATPSRLFYEFEERLDD